MVSKESRFISKSERMDHGDHFQEHFGPGFASFEGLISGFGDELLRSIF